MEFFEIKLDDSFLARATLGINFAEKCEEDPNYGKKCHSGCGKDPKASNKTLKRLIH